MDYAFDLLGMTELLASTDPPNRASIRVMERLGMRFLEAARANGMPIVFYRIKRDEWAAIRHLVLGGRENAGSGSTSAAR